VALMSNAPTAPVTGDLRDRLTEAVLKHFGHDRAGRSQAAVRQARGIADAVMPFVEHAEAGAQLSSERLSEWRQKYEAAQRELQQIRAALNDSSVCAGCMQRELQRDRWAETSRQNGITAEQNKQAWYREQDRARAAEAQVAALQRELAEVTEQRDIRRQDCDDLAEESHERLQRALQAERELSEAKEVAATCICYDGNPANYEGAHADCPVHGAIRAYNEAERELTEARAVWTEWRNRLGGSFPRNMLSDFDAALDASGGTESKAVVKDSLKPEHIGGRANAEDCPACSGTNPPYPFICPGEPVASGGTESTEEAGSWLDDLAKAGPAIYAAKHEPVRVSTRPERTEGEHVDRHGRSWDPHPFVQSRAVDNVRVCICGLGPDHRIHHAAPVSPEEGSDDE
jgi:hypothetical protein